MGLAQHENFVAATFNVFAKVLQTFQRACRSIARFKGYTLFHPNSEEGDYRKAHFPQTTRNVPKESKNTKDLKIQDRRAEYYDSIRRQVLELDQRTRVVNLYYIPSHPLPSLSP